MSAATRRATYAKKPGVRKAAVKRAQALRARRKAEDAARIDVSAVLEYQRGVRHGLEAARAVAYQHNGGRSWTNAEIAGSISYLIGDIPATVVVIGDALKDDSVPTGVDVWEKFWAPRRK